MFRIDKTFEFCYGHRVWTQELDGRYADDLKCACRHLHGHEAKVQVFMEGAELNKQGMVTDFRHLEWLKRMFNEHIDHKFLIDAKDPMQPWLTASHVDGMQMVSIVHQVNEQQRVYLGQRPEHRNRHKEDYVLDSSDEIADGILVVPFVPTSENLAWWVYGIVDSIMRPLNVKVSQVDWWETPKSRSSYVAP